MFYFLHTGIFKKHFKIYYKIEICKEKWIEQKSQTDFSYKQATEHGIWCAIDEWNIVLSVSNYIKLSLYYLVIFGQDVVHVLHFLTGNLFDNQ